MKIKSLLLTVTLNLFLQISFANVAHAAGSDPGSGLALDFLGLGLMGSSQSADTTTISSRTMVGGSAAAEFGYGFSFVEPLVLAEYQYIGQYSDPTGLSNTNTAGSGYRLGAGAKFTVSSFTITAIYDFLSTYTLTQSTSAGKTSYYSSPTGYEFRFGYHLFSNIEVGLTYSADKYKSNTTGGTTTDISTNTFNLTTYGLYADYRLF